MYQLECRQLTSIYELLIKGSRMKFANRDERTLSHLVTESGHVDMVRELLIEMLQEICGNFCWN
jgi:hypothetical protein